MKSPEVSNVLVLGLARNVASTIQRDMLALQKALAGFKRTNFLILESDSNDSTLGVLEQLTQEVANFRYISMGRLRDQIPNRIDRISFCRNKLLESAKKYAEEVDFVVVVDLDGVNTKITRVAIESCWQRDDWEVCTANQEFNYYDIYALRHETLCPNDCWNEYHELRKARLHPMKARQISIYSRQIHIPRESAWIRVNSSFGGLAIYDSNSYFSSGYASRDSEGSLICEHVAFHQRIESFGGRIYINPKMINSSGIRKNSLKYKLFYGVKYSFSAIAPNLFVRRFDE